MQQVLHVDPDEECYWLSERTHYAPETGLPVRVQIVVVRRGGELAMCSEPIELSAAKPPLEINALPMTVAHARARAEAIREARIDNPPPITININGDTYIEADHPALEGVPYGPGNPFTLN